MISAFYLNFALVNEVNWGTEMNICVHVSWLDQGWICFSMVYASLSQFLGFSPRSTVVAHITAVIQ